MIPLRVYDLKQYAYCKRVVYFHHLMPIEKETTFKMKMGNIEEERIDRLEARRGLSRYGLDRGERRFHVDLWSPTLDLSGKLDLLIRVGEEAFPVDFKLTSGQPMPNHILQIAAYAVLVEERLGLKVNRGFVYLLPAEDAVEFELSRKVKDDVRHTIEEVRSMITDEIFPVATRHRRKCTDCEFRNFCGDIR